MKKIFFCCLFFIVLTAPAFAGVSVIGGLTHQRIVKPGEKFKGIILLKNTEAKPCEVKLYQTDYLFSSDGNTVYGGAGDTASRSNAKWITVSPNRLIIPPYDTGSIYYVIQVPEDPSLKGTYWSIVMIEPVPESSPESSSQESPNSEKEGTSTIFIASILRYAIQVVANIGDTGERRIRFIDKKLISKDGKNYIQIDVENSGERWLAPLVRIELYDKDGIYKGRFEGARQRIYPGCSVRNRIDVTDVPNGRYKALVIADNGDEYVFGGQYDLEIEQ